MGLRIRPAVALDADLLFEWRQDDEVNDWWEGTPVQWEQHLDWLIPRLMSPVVQLWVAEAHGIPVGQARLDSNAELAFSTDKDHRRQGYATDTVRKATAAAKSAGWGRVKACVDKSNEASIRTLKAAGFVERDDVGFWINRF